MAPGADVSPVGIVLKRRTPFPDRALDSGGAVCRMVRKRMKNGLKDGTRNRLAEIAYMYHCLDMSQSEISKRTFLSRPHISRLLKQARSEGIVEIRINNFGERSHYAETGLKAKFGLKDARVYNCGDLPSEEVLEAIGRWGAEYVESRLHAGQSVGITRGSIIAGVIQSLRGGRKLDLKVMQLMGGEANNLHAAQDLIRRMVDVFGGLAVHLDAPLYVENDFVRTNLVREPFLRRKLSDIGKAEMVITSVRPLLRGMKTHVWQGFVADRQIDEAIDAGAVGYVLGRAFDSRGDILDLPLNRRIIGMEPAELRKRFTVGLAYGQEYAPAVLGALRGGYLKALITDFGCANEVLSVAGD